MGFTAPLANSFKVLKEHPIIVVPFLAFLILIIIVSVILALVTVGAVSAGASSLFTTGTPSISNLLSVFVPLVLGILIVALIGGAFMQGMYIDLARQGLSGKTISLGGAWDTAKNRALKLIALNILILIIYAVVILILVFITGVPGVINNVMSTYASSFASGTSPGISTFVSLVASVLAFFILLVIAVVIMSVMFYQAPVVVILEDAGVIEALKRSIDIGKKNFVTILVFFIIVGIVSTILSIVISLLGLIPYLGIIIRLAGDVLLGVWAAMIPAMFYFEYIKPMGKKK